jgi:tryptophan 2,3-dioxygenase
VQPRGQRPLEEGIVKLKVDLSYGEYLHLGQILGAQHPVSGPDNHDELLFIIQHQTSELWLKLVLSELTFARRCIAEDSIGPALKALARVKHVQRQLNEQWSVLATLTPSEYAEFRNRLGTSSGFQSWQYRAVEFVLGNKSEAMVEMFGHDPDAQKLLGDLLRQPTVYDEFLRYLSRHSYPVPDFVLGRDVSRPWSFVPELVEVLASIYRTPSAHWEAYETCEELVDIEDNFQLWRFRHLSTVRRTIGEQSGTGGSSGLGFLRSALEQSFFPELYALRSEIPR